MPKSKFLTKKTSFQVFRSAYQIVRFFFDPDRNPPALSTLRIKKTLIRGYFPTINILNPCFSNSRPGSPVLQPGIPLSPGHSQP